MVDNLNMENMATSKEDSLVYSQLQGADLAFFESLKDNDFRKLREKQQIKISDMETSALHLISTMGTIPVETFFKIIKMYYPNATLDEVLYVLDKNSNQGSIYLLYDDDSSCIADTNKYEELRYGQDDEE